VDQKSEDDITGGTGEIKDAQVQETEGQETAGQDTGSDEKISGAKAAPERGEKRGPGFVWGMIAGLVLATVIVGCIYVGKHVADANGKATSIVNTEAEKKLRTIEDIINTYYYQYDDSRNASEQKMEDGMCYGLMQSMGDPYSVYYSKDDVKGLEEETEGVYYGIGAYLSVDEKTQQPKISSVIEGTPAENAGLRADDIIVAIDGKSVRGKELTEVVKLVKGPEGTQVKLKIYREGETDFLEKTVKRAKITTPSAKGKMLDDDIGYIQVTEFDTVTLDQFTDAYATLKGQGAKGLILDLRGNPGGNVDTAVDIGREILPKGTVVYLIDKAGKKTVYSCDGKNEIKIPLVVLVNGNSASASEILTGAIKDDKVGTVVGTTTYGKGIVQNVLALADGTAVKITIAAYYTPSGVNIQGKGIEPDVKCEFDSDAYYKDQTDNQLEKAIEVVKSKIK
jgi:carboxyl-terminal processing protease